MKRFTETSKWADPWFRRLSPPAKLLFLYLTDNCDCTGLIDLDIEAAAFHIGCNVTVKHLSELGNRVQRTEQGKLFIPRFIPFQYGLLSDGCPAHKPVLKLVMERNLSINGKGYQYPNATLSLEYAYSTGKEKEKEKSTEGEVQEGIPTVEEIYRAYPRHESKPDALRAIQKAIKTVGAVKLLERTLAYAKTQPAHCRFTPLPASWYNAERFNDDPAEWIRSDKPPTPLSERDQRIEREIKEARENEQRRKNLQNNPAV